MITTLVRKKVVTFIGNKEQLLNLRNAMRRRMEPGTSTLSDFLGEGGFIYQSPTNGMIIKRNFGDVDENDPENLFQNFIDGLEGEIVMASNEVSA